MKIFKFNEFVNESFFKFRKSDKNTEEVNKDHTFEPLVKADTYSNFDRPIKLGDEKFPCYYVILTKEKSDEKQENGEPVGVIPDGYPFKCYSKDELDRLTKKYKKGGKYRGETIVATTVTDKLY